MAASMLQDGSLPDDIIRSVTGSMYLGTLIYYYSSDLIGSLIE